MKASSTPSSRLITLLAVMCFAACGDSTSAPRPMAGATVNWASSAGAVARVSASELVTAVANGGRHDHGDNRDRSREARRGDGDAVGGLGGSSASGSGLRDSGRYDAVVRRGIRCERKPLPNSCSIALWCYPSGDPRGGANLIRQRSDPRGYARPVRCQQMYSEMTCRRLRDGSEAVVGRSGCISGNRAAGSPRIDDLGFPRGRYGRAERNRAQKRRDPRPRRE